MVKRYLKWDENQRAVFWMTILALVVFLGLLPLFFLGGDKGYSFPLGWILGSVTEIVSFFSILHFSKTMFEENSSHKATIWSSLLAGGFRFFFYAAVLVVSAICTFRSSWFGGFDAFNFYATFLALLPMPIIVMISHLVDSHRKIQKAKAEELGKNKDDLL